MYVLTPLVPMVLDRNLADQWLGSGAADGSVPADDNDIAGTDDRMTAGMEQDAFDFNIDDDRFDEEEPLMADGMKIVSDRWMLQSRQIVNWGSYGGWHEFRPSMDETMPVTLLGRRQRIRQIHTRSTRKSHSSTHPEPPTTRRRTPDVRNAMTTPTCVA